MPREPRIIIALPESLQQSDPDLLLQLFSEKFHTEYGIQCATALHHNTAKTNYHIQIAFAERELLEEKAVKFASKKCPRVKFSS